MIHRFYFYLMYALRNIRRGGRWTTLAILCITAGVATVVALRSLGLAVGDTLTNNVRVEVKGDLLIRNDSIMGGFGSNDPNAFTPAELQRLLDWAEDKGARSSAFMSGRNMQVTKTDASQFGRPSFIGSNFIDPQTYPPTHTILAIDPPDVPLAQLFTGANDVVISDNLAAQSDIKVGDTVRVSGTQDPFIVRGIVLVAEESSVTNFLNAFFGFAYFDLAQAAVVNEVFAPNRIGVIFPESPDEAALDQLAAELEALVPGVRSTDIYDFLERYEVVSQYLGDFVVVMGLGALLIGGVGIMNTMLVLVRRRTNEIAAVKTFGLHGSQVAALFLTEGLLLGFAGSLLGMIVGVGLSAIVNQYGSVALRQALIWKIYPEALVFGFTLGMVVTAIFGVAPILTAVKVRPSIILRPNENHLVALGVLQSVALLIFVTISLGLVVGHIIRPSIEVTERRFAELSAQEQSSEFAADEDPFQREGDAGPFGDSSERSVPNPYLAGVIGVTASFIIFALLIAALWLIIFLIGKLPTFGMVTPRLALRNLSTNRLRTAITLLALTAGMFALSSITFIGEGTRELLSIQLSRAFGGNVLVFPFPGLPQSMVADAIDDALADINISYRTTINNYSTDITSINGAAVDDETELAFTIWQSDKPDVYSSQSATTAGRMLALDDAGQPLIVLPAEFASTFEIAVGDQLQLDSAPALDLQVIGIIDDSEGSGTFTFGPPSALIPPDVLPNSLDSQFTLYAFQVPDAELNRALAELSSVVFALAIDVQFIDGLIGRLIDQFAAIPTIVGLLSLFAAAVIMANTVALSTLERRRQIGILKAIGLKSRRVLQVMFIESSLIGLLSAVIGIGLSAVLISLLSAAGGITIPLPADARLTAFVLLIAAVLIGWTATFLSARVALKERVMNVLRYD